MDIYSRGRSAVAMEGTDRVLPIEEIAPCGPDTGTVLGGFDIIGFDAQRLEVLQPTEVQTFIVGIAGTDS